MERSRQTFCPVPSPLNIPQFQPINNIGPNDKWRTPLEIIRAERLFAYIGGDPAGHPESLVKARWQYLVEQAQDGLLLPWPVYPWEIAHWNPPYSMGNLPAWTAKAAKEWRDNRTASIGVLLGDVYTGWFQETCAENASAFCLWRGRVSHVGPKSGTPRGGTVLVYFGERVNRFIDVFQHHGLAVAMANVHGAANLLAKAA